MMVGCWGKASAVSFRFGISKNIISSSVVKTQHFVSTLKEWDERWEVKYFRNDDDDVCKFFLLRRNNLKNLSDFSSFQEFRKF